MTEKQTLVRRAARVASLAQRGEHGRGRPKKNSFDNSKKIKANQGGTSANYRLAKLARDYPEIHARVINNEFKRVSEAERAAGIKPAKRRLKGQWQRSSIQWLSGNATGAPIA